ncbi:ATP-dependent DNA helicase [Aristophania vespae]|uniref:ATP-dependent DNA helicase n=1 Tax=Aristophania vespae TaxID=2697033 RepID=UPI0023519709|nr:ATP-dependent DNA helicase [Aristophania vespae]UMM64675.1 3'-5' exonuclease DinG [Aristophania vespae]
MSETFLSPFDLPALIAKPGVSSFVTPDGEMLRLPNHELRPILKDYPPPLLVHGPETLRLLDLPPETQPVPWLDLLELFLFIHPAQSLTPTPRGLSLALGLLKEEENPHLEANVLYNITHHLLSQLSEYGTDPLLHKNLTLALAPLSKAGWSWAETVKLALNVHSDEAENLSSHKIEPYFGDVLKIWQRLPQWEEEAPRPPPGSQSVSVLDARKRLAEILGPDAETRTGQADFSSVASYSFQPRTAINAPNIVLAEAGTGTGKTLGYIAPASIWSETNSGTVWISTYTRHLQRQIEQEITKLYPDPTIRRKKVVIRKGRENYLCLLNLEDITVSTLNRPTQNNPQLIALSLLVRWAEVTADGDLQGGDLPGWFGDLFGHSLITTIADRRGECIHSACQHYQRCFIENSIRKARHADFVIANHALVLSQAAWNALVPKSLAPADLTDENGVPTHIIFDEGHHIFEASDNAFAHVFSGLEAAELRRWLLGAEGGRSRARGLQRRMDDLIEIFPPIKDILQALLTSATLALPQPRWSIRLQEARDARASAALKTDEETLSEEAVNSQFSQEPLENPAENFLHALDHLLETRLIQNTKTKDAEQYYNRQEIDLHPASEDVLHKAEVLIEALQQVLSPLDRLINYFASIIEQEDELDPALIQRVEATTRSLYRRAFTPVQGWLSMLRALAVPPQQNELPLYIDFIRRDRFSVPRLGSEGFDIALHRHWLDPTIPFASILQTTTHGLLITSATLRDQREQRNDEEAWHRAEQRVGIPHFLKPPVRAALLSPFDYAQQTRAYVITDISSEIASLSRAFQALFETSNGGALGLFTAINRLKAVYKHIEEPLGRKNISLYAQHIDAMDNATLVDIFRTERNSCLLGTDAMRDGVDIPGDALRMVVFERTPWPRPDILHRERRRYLSNGNSYEYDDFVTRIRLRQAFGRLIRRKNDKGVFVMLDRRLPTRLLSAFPEGVDVKRLPLSEALEEIAEFLNSDLST